MKKVILKSNLILGFQYLFGAIIPIVLMPFVLKEIGIKEFGIYSIFISWATMGSVFILYVFQLTGPIALEKIKATNSKLELTKEIFLAKLIIFIIWLIFLPLLLLISPYESNQLQNILLILILIPLSSLLNSTWFLQYHQKFLTLCKLSFLGAIVPSIIILIMKLGGYKNELAIISTFYIYPFIVGLGTFIKSSNILSMKDNFLLSCIRKKNIYGAIDKLKNNFSLFFSQMIALGYGVSGPIFIGYLSGPEEAGKFSILEKIFTPIISVSLLTHTAAFPKLLGLWERDKEKYLHILIFVTKIYLLAVLLITSIYLIMQNKINFFVFGNLENKYLFIGFLLWVFIAFAGPLLTSYLTISNQNTRVMQMNIFVLLLVVSISTVLTMKYGALGWILGLTIAHVPILILFAYTIFKLNLKIKS
ncbi:oligosaccharide flippase family protein [Candidatus Methylopumilus planktonicus]|jgi:PST family polysaccharide transporter|uniref:oligosaccharide flippase family protein n=1 Tax=Candidatus Methylopumilus planktonicus TaxID=1581557 RepID=UPI003BEF305D